MNPARDKNGNYIDIKNWVLEQADCKEWTMRGMKPA